MQHIDELNRRIEELVSLRDTLGELVSHCQGTTARTARSSRTWPTVLLEVAVTDRSPAFGMPKASKRDRIVTNRDFIQ